MSDMFTQQRQITPTCITRVQSTSKNAPRAMSICLLRAGENPVWIPSVRGAADNLALSVGTKAGQHPCDRLLISHKSTLPPIGYFGCALIVAAAALVTALFAVAPPESQLPLPVAVSWHSALWLLVHLSHTLDRQHNSSIARQSLPQEAVIFYVHVDIINELDILASSMSKILRK